MAHPGHHRLADDSAGPTDPGHSPERGRSGTRVIAATASVAVIFAVAAAIAFVPSRTVDSIAGQAQAANYIDIGDSDFTPGSGVDSNSGGTADGGMAVRRVPPTESEAPSARDDALVGAIVTDLTEFWSTALPPITGRPFTPLRSGLTAVDSSSASGTSPCVTTPADIVGNAYYCPSSDGIVYDATTLVPVVLHRYGVGGLITTFAHEFGHAMQARIDTSHAHGADQNPSADGVTQITKEARADCAAGAFLAWVHAGHAPHLHLDGDSGVGKIHSGDLPLSVIGPLVDFSDPTTVKPNDPTAHGLSVDRLTWFITGYRTGADACTHLGEPLITALGRTSPADDAEAARQEPRYANRQLLLTAAEQSIDAFSGKHGDGTPPQELLESAAPHGQFAQATVLALATATSAGANSSAAACFAGSWVRSVFGQVTPGQLGSWPGDADEGLAAVLLQPDASFAGAEAYIDGFRSGSAAC
ncbi:MAG: neutral zinc metallopeptidase [Nakamurella sp.]